MQPHLEELLEIHNAQLDAIDQFVKRQPRFMPRWGESACSHNERLSRDAGRRRKDFFGQHLALLEDLKARGLEENTAGGLAGSHLREFEISLIGRSVVPCEVILLKERR